MKAIFSLAAGAILAIGLAPANAAIVVASTTDIFLASQPAGSTVSGFFGTDTAPANSPVRLNVVGGATLTFAATGSTSVDANCFAGPDGGCYDNQSSFSPPPADGTYNGPASALIGVFLDASDFDVATGPAGLDYTVLANRSLLAQALGLHQIFLIGDGLDGTGSGTVQQFTAPLGATRLYLAVADSIGSSVGNLGSLTVDFTGATAAAVPEPATWALMLGGFGLAGSVLRQRRGPAAA